MVSTITQRIGGAVAGTPVNTGAGGVIEAINITGTNAIVADTTPEISAYFANQLFLVRPFAANTGAVTLNLGPGALPWHKPGGADFANGDLSPNIEYLIKMASDLTEFRTIAPSG